MGERVLQGAGHVHSADRVQLPAAGTPRGFRRQEFDDALADGWPVHGYWLYHFAYHYRYGARDRWLRHFVRRRFTVVWPGLQVHGNALAAGRYRYINDDPAAWRIPDSRPAGSRQTHAGCARRQGYPDGRRPQRSLR